jgi:hypothetical protein
MLHYISNLCFLVICGLGPTYKIRASRFLSNSNRPICTTNTAVEVPIAVSRPTTPIPTSAWPVPSLIDIVGAGADEVAEPVAKAVAVEAVAFDIAA